MSRLGDLGPGGWVVLFACTLGALALFRRALFGHRPAPRHAPGPLAETRVDDAVMLRANPVTTSPTQVVTDDTLLVQTDDPDAWLGPLRRGGLRAERRLTTYFGERGWLVRRQPRRASKRLKRELRRYPR